MGAIANLRDYWDQLCIHGPAFGYLVNARKSWLITKEDQLSAGETAFENTGVKVTAEGRPYLGAAIGTPDYIQQHVTSKVSEWSKELAEYAKTHLDTTLGVMPQSPCTGRSSHGVPACRLMLADPLPQHWVYYITCQCEGMAH